MFNKKKIFKMIVFQLPYQLEKLIFQLKQVMAILYSYCCGFCLMVEWKEVIVL